MLASFFRLGMIAPGRQLGFRRAIVAHLLILSALAWGLALSPTQSALIFVGHALVAAGIVEGAALIGWRLTQLPKSQSLEFLLSSPTRPWVIFLAEALVGICRFALVTFAGLPILLLMLFGGMIEPIDLLPLLLLPFTWGAIAGIGLTVWAYETMRIRALGERVALVGILIYLLTGVLAGENLRSWLQAMPQPLGEVLYGLFQMLHSFNPFGVMQYWLESQRVPIVAVERMAILQIASLAFLALLVARAMLRFKGHFDDRHYRAIDSSRLDETGRIGQRPLSWWAVRRVMEYSGRVNIWLAGGFGLLYAAYIVAGDHWPVWMGRLVFQIFERMGGGPALITGLVVLSAVPAAFQYGLWDSSAQDRRRRLELLLLTELDALDYWNASLAAAWRRGWGYSVIAMVLWIALGVSGRASAPQIISSIAAALILWSFSFVLGFLLFSKGRQANGLGALMTLGMPLLVFAALKAGQPAVAALLPAGAIYVSLTEAPSWWWLPGPIVVAAATLWLARRALNRCESDLRAWYALQSG